MFEQACVSFRHMGSEFTSGTPVDGEPFGGSSGMSCRRCTTLAPAKRGRV